MNPALWLDNLTAWSLQAGLLSAAGLALPRILRLREPRAVYGFLQFVLGLCLLLPVLQPWQPRVLQVLADVSWIADVRPDSFGAAGPASPLDPHTILMVLAAGAVVRLLWLAAGLARLRSYRNSGRPLPQLHEAVSEMTARLGVRARILCSSEINAPVTFGLVRPVVLLPESSIRMDPKRQEAVACHELLHVKRRDWALTLAEELLRAFLWFHPLVLWLIARIRLAREQVVDALVVRRTQARQPYVMALLEIAAGPRISALAAPSFVTKRDLVERVSLLAKESSMSVGKLAVRLAAAVLVLALTGALAVCAYPRRVHRVGGDVVAPQLIEKLEPQYTEIAKDKKIQGTVLLGAHIGPDGRVSRVKVLKSLDPGLDTQAIKAIRRWKFLPGKKAGKPVTVAATIEVNFRLL